MWLNQETNYVRRNSGSTICFSEPARDGSGESKYSTLIEKVYQEETKGIHATALIVGITISGALGFEPSLNLHKNSDVAVPKARSASRRSNNLPALCKEDFRETRSFSRRLKRVSSSLYALDTL